MDAEFLSEATWIQVLKLIMDEIKRYVYTSSYPPTKVSENLERSAV